MSVRCLVSPTSFVYVVNITFMTNEELATILDVLSSKLRAGALTAQSFSQMQDKRTALIPKGKGATTQEVPSPRIEILVVVSDPVADQTLSALRDAYTAHSGRRHGVFDVDMREYAYKDESVPVSDPAFNVFSAGASRVLCKPIKDVSSQEKIRFYHAWLSAFETMSPSALARASRLREDAENLHFATDDASTLLT